ncbi:Tim44/TimA family putative adaptor protein [Bradyrhizobium betae]|nr:Tim44/TimA family putative adaptor protein [Bradyrhizobium betae]
MRRERRFPFPQHTRFGRAAEGGPLLQATNTLEVMMPEDGGGSGLVSLFWGLWMYWFFSSWCEHFLSASNARDARQSRRATSPAAASARRIAAECAGVETTVLRILERCGGIAVDDFLAGRLPVYEAIVAAFDAGDRTTLQTYVSAEVYDDFSEAIAAREARQQTTETRFVRIEPPEIVAAHFDEARAEISIRFVTDSYKLMRNASGQSIESMHAERHSLDVWTFGSMPSTNDWRLIATGAS